MQRFFKSIEFIEENINKKISVHEIAAASCYSTYHFCRVFKALVGDSPKEYLRKRRLTIAAKKLFLEDCSILQLALDCQFESQEAFTRAFKSHFHLTPSQYKKHNNPNEKNQLLFREIFSPKTLNYLQNQLSMDPEITVRPEMKVVGMSTHYDNNDLNLKRLWAPFLAYPEPIPNTVGNEGFGIYESSKEINGEAGFSYMCAVEVSSIDYIPKGMTSRVIPEQCYAIFTHKGPLASLNETLKYIWGSWLPKSKYQYIEKPDFELYPKDFDDEKPNNKLYLHIPVVPR